DLQHLPHAGATLRALVPDDHRVTGLDLVGEDGGQRVFLTVEYPGRAAVPLQRVVGDLDHAPLRSQVPLEDDEAALRAERVRERPHHFLAGSLLRGGALLLQGAAGDGQRRPVRVATFYQAPGQHRDAAGAVQLRSSEPPARLQVAQKRRAPRDAVEIVQGQVDAHLARQRDQVQDSVRRAARRGYRSGCVLEGSPGQDLRGPEVRAERTHDDLAQSARGGLATRVDGWDRVVADGGEADHLHHHRTGDGRIPSTPCSWVWPGAGRPRAPGRGQPGASKSRGSASVIRPAVPAPMASKISPTAPGRPRYAPAMIEPE